MSFDPERWLQVADVCTISIPKVDAEAMLRTAVNRAYYAASMSVRKRIEAVLGAEAVPTFGTHEAVLQAVRTGGPGFNEVYDALREMRTARKQADYELGTAPLVRHEVETQIRRRRRLIRNRINAFHDEEYRRLKIPPKSNS